jgi:predicted nucleic acid-binding protein
MGGKFKRNAGNEMSIIVDTTVWIDAFNPKVKTPEKEILAELILNDKPIFLCPVIYQEILQGIKDDKIFERTKFILQQYRMLDIEIITVTNYAVDLYRYLRKKGITIRKSMDCLIASYAILSDMYLLHNDFDFTQIAKGTKLKLFNVRKK